jgi:type I restriction enzyme S subunit
MEVKPGYKMAEFGVIPEDWEVKQIGDLKPFITSGSRGWAVFYSDRGSPFIRITNLSRSDINLDLSDLRLVNLKKSNSEAIRARIQNEDILISITADIGIIGYVSAKVPKPAYINQHIALIRLGSLQTNPKFVSYFLASEKPQKLFRALTDSGAKAGMNLITVQRICLALPPSLAEQEAIAEALSDADSLIESLEQLIAKKRQIKQGAMQELLTGKRRLPGFSGEWEIKKLGSISEIVIGRTPARLNPAYWGRGLKWLSIADLQSKVVTESKEEITKLAAEEMQVVPKGTLLMSFKLSIGRLSFAGCDLYTNEAICSFINLKANSEFLYYALSRTDFSLYGKQAVKGYTLNKESLKQIEIVLPPEVEQTAIATILSDMDEGIAALEARLAKARSIKQGMMQELLTGKIRLV